MTGESSIVCVPPIFSFQEWVCPLWTTSPPHPSDYNTLMTSLIPTGAAAPDFTLPDLQGVHHTLSYQRGQIVILNFWSAECPACERVDQDLAVLLPAWPSSVRLWYLASNVNEPLALLLAASAQRRVSPVLQDTGHKIADLYGAITTPQFFVIDPKGRLQYQGTLDDRTFRQRTAKRFYLKDAVEALLQGDLPPVPETPSYGCTIVRSY